MPNGKIPVWPQLPEEVNYPLVPKPTELSYFPTNSLHLFVLPIDTASPLMFGTVHVACFMFYSFVLWYPDCDCMTYASVIARISLQGVFLEPHLPIR